MAIMTVAVIRSLFAAHGLPLEVLLHSRPQFHADGFQDFLNVQYVKYTFNPPYHLQSNRVAGRAVQTTKTALLKLLLEDREKGSTRTLQHRIHNFLMLVNNATHIHQDDIDRIVAIVNQIFSVNLTRAMTKEERVKQ